MSRCITICYFGLVEDIMYSLSMTLCVSPLGPCWMFLTSAITSRSPMRSAKEGEGECADRFVYNVSVYILITFTLFVIIDFSCFLL